MSTFSRTQFVRIGIQTSAPTLYINGISQSSILGSLLIIFTSLALLKSPVITMSNSTTMRTTVSWLCLCPPVDLFHLFQQLHWLSVEHSINIRLAAVTTNILHLLSTKLSSPIRLHIHHSLRASDTNRPVIPFLSTAFGLRAFSVAATSVWHGLPQTFALPRPLNPSVVTLISFSDLPIKPEWSPHLWLDTVD